MSADCPLPTACKRARADISQSTETQDDPHNEASEATTCVAVLSTVETSGAASPAKKLRRDTDEMLRATSRSLSSEPAKLALVVRGDLGMGKGKMCAQCSHAALGAYRNAASHRSKASILEQWERYGQTTVALKVGSEQELLDLKRRAAADGLNQYVVRDAGRTQIEAGSLTVLAIGPDVESKVSAVTGHLKLL